MKLPRNQGAPGTDGLTNFLQASRCGSGMLFSTALISPGPKPVTVLLCLGRVKFAGPTGPCRSASGALVEGRRSLGDAEAAVAIFKMSIAEKGELLSECRCRTGDGGVEGRIVEERKEERSFEEAPETWERRSELSKPVKLGGASVYNQAIGWQRVFTPQKTRALGRQAAGAKDDHRSINIRRQ